MGCNLSYAKEAFGLLRPVSEEEMDRNIGWERAWPSDDFWSATVEPSPSVRSEPTASLSLSRGEALILVLSLSFGLWAAIWGLSPCWLWAGDCYKSCQ
jgi:hypothetical protein